MSMKRLQPEVGRWSPFRARLQKGITTHNEGFLSACLCVCLSACICLPACLPPCLPPCLPALPSYMCACCLHIFLPAFLASCLYAACLCAGVPGCILSCLFSCIVTWLPVFMHACLHSCIHALLPACLIDTLTMFFCGLFFTIKEQSSVFTSSVLYFHVFETNFPFLGQHFSFWLGICWLRPDKVELTDHQVWQSWP